MRYALLEKATGDVLNVIELESTNLCIETGEGHPSLTCTKYHPGVDRSVRHSEVASPGERWDGQYYHCQHESCGKVVQDMNGARSHLCDPACVPCFHPLPDPRLADFALVSQGMSPAQQEALKRLLGL